MTSSNGTISTLLAFCAWIPRAKAIDAQLWCFFLCLNKRLSKQSWGRWFETQSCSLWRHFYATPYVPHMVIWYNRVKIQCYIILWDDDNSLSPSVWPCRIKGTIWHPLWRHYNDTGAEEIWCQQSHNCVTYVHTTFLQIYQMRSFSWTLQGISVIDYSSITWSWSS